VTKAKSNIHCRKVQHSCPNSTVKLQRHPFYFRRNNNKTRCKRSLQHSDLSSRSWKMTTLNRKFAMERTRRNLEKKMPAKKAKKGGSSSRKTSNSNHKKQAAQARLLPPPMPTVLKATASVAAAASLPAPAHQHQQRPQDQEKLARMDTTGTTNSGAPPRDSRKRARWSER
jgi:hypothetical protein